MSDISKYTILVVDSNKEQICFVSELLRSEGCRIIAATSCTDAFELLEKYVFHLILLDIAMPEMDGFTFCKRIKRDERYCDIPVIFSTAYHDSINLSKGFLAGGCDYVVKPYIPEELKERVKVRIHYAEIRTQLQRANDELDRFCYTLSHDVRAPLYVIKQLAELLRSEVEAGNYAEVREICGMLEEKSMKTASMADGLYRFSKVFYEELKYEEIDLDQIIPDIFYELLSLETDRRISFEKHGLGKVIADKNLFYVALQNIISNAIKFTKKTSVAKIVVYAEHCLDYVKIHVEDNGIGFEQSQAEELLQVFWHTSEEEYPGDGIGLATVKRIMDRHNGSIVLTGKKGEGAHIILSLPIVE